MKNMNNFKRTLSFLTASMTLALAMTGCGDKSSDSSEKYIDTKTSSNTEQAEETTSLAEDTNENTSKETEKDSSALEADALSNTVSAVSDLFSKRDLSGDYDSVDAEITLNGDSADADGSGVTVDGSVITITQEGVYYITGTLDDGQIIVNADKAKVQLVLDNASIACSNSSAIYIIDADKTFITLAKGSKNVVSDGSSYEFADETATEPDAAIFSSDSLTINGSGSLEVNGNYNDGIHSKDDIVITGGNITVNAVGDGIKGKDYVAVADGNITVTAGQDGIKSTNTSDTSLGFVYIEGGTFNITADGDGIQAETVFNAIGGDFNITAGGGSSASTKTHTDDFGGGMGGGMMGGGGRMGGGFGGNFNEDFAPDNFDFGDFNPEDFDFGDFDPEYFGGGRGGFGGSFNSQQDTTDASEITFTELANVTLLANETDSSEDDGTVSTKGIKSGTELIISGGTFYVSSADDTLHSNDTLTISGGTVTLDAGDDGIHADSQIDINGGTVSINKSYEGIEAPVINVNDGLVEVKSSDDGFNASDGSNNMMGQGVDGVVLNINGGTVYVDADGDGLDSNNDMYINGGTVIVNGPTNSGNGALDSETGITVTGGLVVAAGMSGMAEYPESSSTQNSVSATFDSTYEGGTLVTLLDSEGNEIISFAPSKSFNNIVISSPDITDGVTYTFYNGGSSSSEEAYGLYTNGGYNNDGSEAGSFTVSSATSFVGTQSMMGGGGMMGGGMGGGRQGMTPPTGSDGMPEMPNGNRGNFSRN